MVEPQERAKKFQDAALLLTDDAVDMAGRLRKYVRTGQFDRARDLAGLLQRTARDAKWLMQRQPKSGD